MRPGKTKSEILRFIMVGTVSVILDFIIYRILGNYGIGSGPAKGVSFFCGAVAGFIINKLWTFESRATGSIRREIPKYILLYMTTALINTGVNTMALGILASEAMVDFYIQNINIAHYSQVSYIFAFLAATGVSMILNFAGLKFFVFREIRS